MEINQREAKTDCKTNEGINLEELDLSSRAGDGWVGDKIRKNWGEIGLYLASPRPPDARLNKLALCNNYNL